MDSRDDAVLVRAWVAGDLNAGNVLLSRHTRTLRRFFRNKCDSEEVKDLVQSTFEGCAKGIQRFTGGSSFETYMRRIAHNKLVDHYRRKRTRSKGMAEFKADRDAIVDVVPGISTLFAARREHKLLLKALQRLPLEQQVLLEHRFREGLSGPTLAELYECPLGTIRSRIAQAKKSLRAMILTLEEDPGVTESTLGDLEGWARSLPEE